MIQKIQTIIYDIEDGVPYFLIFHRILHWKGWEFLKETMESGESQLACLRRGIREETHLRNYKIQKRLNKRSQWRWKGQTLRIVQVYLVRAPMEQEVTIRQKIMEHDQYRWVTKAQALKMLTHKNHRRWLRELRP